MVATSLPTGSRFASCSLCSCTFLSWIPGEVEEENRQLLQFLEVVKRQKKQLPKSIEFEVRWKKSQRTWIWWVNRIQLRQVCWTYSEAWHFSPKTYNLFSGATCAWGQLMLEGNLYSGATCTRLRLMLECDLYLRATYDWTFNQSVSLLC